MIVYIICASGPYPEKAAYSKFWLVQEDAEKECAALNDIFKPVKYTVYKMIMEPAK